MIEAHYIDILLGAGFIADYYTRTLHGQRTMDRVHIAYSRSAYSYYGKNKWYDSDQNRSNA